jgi:hypothetical protein
MALQRYHCGGKRIEDDHDAVTAVGGNQIVQEQQELAGPEAAIALSQQMAGFRRLNWTLLNLANDLAITDLEWRLDCVAHLDPVDTLRRQHLVDGADGEMIQSC